MTNVAARSGAAPATSCPRSGTVPVGRRSVTRSARRDPTRPALCGVCRSMGSEPLLELRRSSNARVLAAEEPGRMPEVGSGAAVSLPSAPANCSGPPRATGFPARAPVDCPGPSRWHRTRALLPRNVGRSRRYAHMEGRVSAVGRRSKMIALLRDECHRPRSPLPTRRLRRPRAATSSSWTERTTTAIECGSWRRAAT